MSAGTGKLTWTEDLAADLEQQSRRLETASPEEIIRWAVERFFPHLTMATAFGPEGCVILALLAKIEPRMHVFNLETGYQFPETLELRERIAQKYGIEVELKKPAITVDQYETLHGGPLHQINPDQGCMDRRIKILQEAVADQHAWRRGIRWDQSRDRAEAPIVGWDQRFGLVKISPLANQTKSDIWKRILQEDIPYNPLHDKGYPSIGCWPCTRKTSVGEDERAGRWSGQEKTECGLHSIEFEQGGGI